MRSLLLSLCFVFALIAGYSHISYGADFSYNLDRFIQVGGTSVTPGNLVDEFIDDLEPPSGPPGPGTYGVITPFSPTAESGGLLNLSSNDALMLPGTSTGMERYIGVTNETAVSFLQSGEEGIVQGKFNLTNGINVNTGFGISIIAIPAPDNAPPLESVFLDIDKSPSGKIFAYFDSDLNGVETDISTQDITSFIFPPGSPVVTDVTLMLYKNPANEVNALLDFGSDGTFDLQMTGSHSLNFLPGKDYTGNFAAWSFSDVMAKFMENPDGSVSVHIVNDYDEPMPLPLEWKLWVEFAGQKFPIINIGSDGSFVLPSPFDLTLPLFPSGTFPAGATIGTRMVDPVTGQEFCVDTVVIQ